MTPEEARRMAENLYRQSPFRCAEVVWLTANALLGKPLPDEAVRLASGFPSGLGHAGCVCGALAGGVMGLGLKYGRSRPEESNHAAQAAAKELHDRFKARRKATCCRVLIAKMVYDSPERRAQCAAITGEVAADVADLLLHGLPQDREIGGAR